MEQPLPALVFQIFGFAISILALLAESHSQNDVNSPATPSLVSRMPPPPPSPHSPIPLPPPLYHRLRPPAPLPPPPYHRLRPPPAPLPPPPYNRLGSGTAAPLPPPPYNRLGSRTAAPLPPPPYHRLRPPSPPPQDRRRRKSNNGSNYRPPPPEKTINTGKKIGLLFVGIAAILQIGVVGFLAFKRRQLLKLRDSYETSS